jgi:polyhydroxyalkanoate synthase
MWENKLLKGALTLNGTRIDMANIKVPVFHAVAQHDHIVPYDASKPLIASVGAEDKKEIVLKGGHVSVVAGPNAVKRLWPALDQWLGERSV